MKTVKTTYHGTIELTIEDGKEPVLAIEFPETAYFDPSLNMDSLNKAFINMVFLLGKASSQVEVMNIFRRKK